MVPLKREGGLAGRGDNKVGEEKEWERVGGGRVFARLDFEWRRLSVALGRLRIVVGWSCNAVAAGCCRGISAAIATRNIYICTSVLLSVYILHWALMSYVRRKRF